MGFDCVPNDPPTRKRHTPPSSSHLSEFREGNQRVVGLESMEQY